MRAVTGWLVWVVAAGLLLTGCSSEPGDASTLPRLSPSPTPTASPTHSIPSPNWSPEQQLAADAALLFTIELNRLFQTGSSNVESTFDATCAMCQQQVDRMRTLREGGRTVRGGDIRELTTDPREPAGNTVAVTVTGKQSPVEILDGSGNVVDDFGEGTFVWALQVSLVDARPLVVQMDFLS